MAYTEHDLVFEAALEALNATELRELVRGVLPWLDGLTEARLRTEVIDRAARMSGGWSPSSPSEGRVEEIEAYIAARRAGAGWPCAASIHRPERPVERGEVGADRGDAVGGGEPG